MRKWNAIKERKATRNLLIENYWQSIVRLCILSSWNHFCQMEIGKHNHRLYLMILSDIFCQSITHFRLPTNKIIRSILCCFVGFSFQFNSKSVKWYNENPLKLYALQLFIFYSPYRWRWERSKLQNFLQWILLCSKQERLHQRQPWWQEQLLSTCQSKIWKINPNK